MLTTIITFVLTLLGAGLVIQRHKSELRHSPNTFYLLYFYHLFFFGVYYAYALATNSDSFRYYRTVVSYGDYSWFAVYGLGTRSIHTIAYPFINYFGFSYEAVMLVFAFFGFLGFIYFYLFLVERVEYRHRLFGVDFILLILFLPNMHFWTVSLGKGSIIFMGIGLLFYGLGNLTKRWLPLALGVIIVFHVRVHILLAIMLALAATALFSSRGIKTWQKVLMLTVALLATAPLLDTFLEYAQLGGTDTESLEGFTEHRGRELGKADSGLDINNYNQAMKLFTFLFRPLFVDAPNAMGIMVSLENLLYLFLFIKLLSGKFIRYLIGAPWLVKASLIAFFAISLALAQISGNMGIAIRQKSQVMYLFFFVVIAYADYRYNRDRKVVIGE